MLVPTTCNRKRHEAVVGNIGKAVSAEHAHIGIVVEYLALVERVVQVVPARHVQVIGGGIAGIVLENARMLPPREAVTFQGWRYVFVKRQHQVRVVFKQVAAVFPVVALGLLTAVDRCRVGEFFAPENIVSVTCVRPNQFEVRR